MLKTALAALLILLAAPALAEDFPPLKFSNAVSPAHDAAQRMLSKEGREKIGADYVWVAEIDFDLDGIMDMIAFGYSSWFCGSAGCVPNLYRGTGDGHYKPVDIGMNDMTNSDPQFWTSPNKVVNGHRVFHLEFESLTGDFVWDNGEYVRAE